MKKTYRAALVGTGSIGDAHVRAIEGSAGRVELVAAVDIDPGRLGEFCRRNRIPAAHADFDAMLQQEKPDLVLIATPPAQHAALSIAAMQAGAWVLCEKPLCASLAELDRIQETEQRTGCYTACVFQMRFASSTAHLRTLADRGMLGRPLLAICNTLWYRDTSYYAVPWRGKWDTELGGPTMGQGIHAMDHLLYLLGDWAEVRAQVATLDRAVEVEDVSMAMVRFANDAQAAIVNSVLSPRQETYLRIDYQRASVELTHLYTYRRDNWKFTLADGQNEGDVLAQAWQNSPPDIGSTHTAQLTALVTDMDADRRPLTSGDEARHTIELLTAIYKSAGTGQPVLRGSIPKDDPFYASTHGGIRPRRAAALR